MTEEKKSAVELFDDDYGEKWFSDTASFEEDLEFTRNLVFLLRTGDAVRAFVREKDEGLRATAIGVKVQDGQIEVQAQKAPEALESAGVAPPVVS